MTDPTFATVLGARPEGRALDGEELGRLRGAVLEMALGGVRLDVLAWLEAEPETRDAWIVALDKIETTRAKVTAAETGKALGAMMLAGTR